MTKKNRMHDSVDKAMRECQAMINYAMAQGQKVSPQVLSSLEKFKLYKDYLNYLDTADKDKNAGSRGVGSKPHPFETYSHGQMMRMGGNTVMARGEEVAEVYVPSEEEMTNELLTVHQDLSKSVYPATPSTIMLLEEQKRKPLRFLGPVPLVQRMTILAFLCLVTTVGLFLFPEVDAMSVNQNILNFEDPMKFVLNELVILSIAAAGASFYALFEAYKYIANASYDTKYESIYWIRFILGIMSGVILAQFIFIDPTAYGGSAADTTGGSQSLGGFITYKPLLAFLGGFSARVVHKILNSLVDSLETFISGSARDMLRAREESAKVQMEDKINTIKRENAANETNHRFQSALKLLKLQEELKNGNGSNTAELNVALQDLINQQLGPVAGEIDSPFTVVAEPKQPINYNEPVINPDDIVMPGDLPMDPPMPNIDKEPKDGGDDNPSFDINFDDIPEPPADFKP